MASSNLQRSTVNDIGIVQLDFEDKVTYHPYETDTINHEEFLPKEFHQQETIPQYQIPLEPIKSLIIGNETFASIIKSESKI